MIDRITYVYVFFDYRVTGWYKIGYSSNPAARLHKLHKGLPFKFLSEFALIPTLDCKALEKQLHDKFEHKHKRNEYFELDRSDLDYILELEKTAKQLIPIKDN